MSDEWTEVDGGMCSQCFRVAAWCNARNSRLCGTCFAVRSRKPHGDHPAFPAPVPAYDGKDDDGKLRFSLASTLAERERVAVMTYGAIKYGPRSWATVPRAVERYQDAAGRHWHAYRCGEEFDAESGLMHLAHLQICIDFLIEFEHRGSDDDFRIRFEAAKEKARKLAKK